MTLCAGLLAAPPLLTSCSREGQVILPSDPHIYEADYGGDVAYRHLDHVRHYEARNVEVVNTTHVRSGVHSGPVAVRTPHGHYPGHTPPGYPGGYHGGQVHPGATENPQAHGHRRTHPGVPPAG